MNYTRVYASGGAVEPATDAQERITVSVAAPTISMRTPKTGKDLRFEVGAQLGSDQFAEVTFAVKVGNGKYEVIGTDNNLPYRVFYDASALPKGTDLTPVR
jgi:hypothetical protein